MKLVVKNKNYTKGEIIKIIREWTYKTKADFGKMIGRSESSIQKYEADEVNYSIETLLNIAKEHKITIIFEKR